MSFCLSDKGEINDQKLTIGIMSGILSKPRGNKTSKINNSNQTKCSYKNSTIKRSKQKGKIIKSSSNNIK